LYLYLLERGATVTIDQLRYFYEVAKCLNFSQASHNLYISQPNLTKYIANLEKELGFRLFDRSTHHCTLTEDGRNFLQHTEELFYQLNSHIEDAKLRAQNTYQLVTIGNARSELPPHVLLRSLNEMNRSSGNTRYLIRDDSYLGLIEKLRTREYDVIITTDRNVRYNDEFHHIKLQSFEMLLAIHNSNPKAKRISLRPEDCTDEVVFISIPDGKNAPINRIEEIFFNAGCRLNINIMPSPDDIMVNAQIGAGVAMVPNTIDADRYHDMVYYRFEHPRELFQSLVWRKDETRPQILSFVETIKAMCPFGNNFSAPIQGPIP
jgi:DNA-binding transcriptional LysR family regulator